MRTLENLCMPLLEALEMRAIEYTMPLVGHSMSGAEGPLEKLSGNGWSQESRWI